MADQTGLEGTKNESEWQEMGSWDQRQPMRQEGPEEHTTTTDASEESVLNREFVHIG